MRQVARELRGWLLAAWLGAVLTILIVGRFENGHVRGHRRTWNTIMFRSPCS